MYKASHEAVIQQANIQLVGIRYAEIQYFTQFFTTFGTQCFLLAGFICGAVSQTPAFGATCHYFWQILYNISSASCISFATMGLLISVFISVFGQGLAIRGPPGSMIKAIEGMVVEQHHAVALFVGAAISYVLQEIGMFFVMMDTLGAVISSVFVILVAMYTYNAAVRIYNRFYFIQEKMADQWNEDRDPAEELGDLNPTVFNNSGKDSATSNGKGGLKTTLLGSGANSSSNGGKPEKSMLGKVVSKVKKTVVGKKQENGNNTEMDDEGMMRESMKQYGDNPYYDDTEDSNTPYVNMNDEVKATPTVAGGSVIGASTTTGTKSSKISESTREKSTTKLKYSGHLTVKGAKKGFGLSDPWERRFFVVEGNFIYYYKDKKAYELEPQNPINRRPIDLEGYTLVAGAVEPPYNISLVPIEADDIRKAWKFRCDTLTEFNNWIEVLTSAIKTYNQDVQGDFVSVIHEER
jgi:hypothetical protein